MRSWYSFLLGLNNSTMPAVLLPLIRSLIIQADPFCHRVETFCSDMILICRRRGNEPAVEAPDVVPYNRMRTTSKFADVTGQTLSPRLRSLREKEIGGKTQWLGTFRKLRSAYENLESDTRSCPRPDTLGWRVRGTSMAA